MAETVFTSSRKILRALAQSKAAGTPYENRSGNVVPYRPLPKEDDPFLGVRGIRLCLRKPELFIPQLRAIYRPSTTGPVKIMFPMIATFEDLIAAKQMAEQVRVELGVPPAEIGIMIEVPSAVLMAEELARDPAGALILTGLGITELSMSMPSLAALKSAMRRYSSAQAKEFARRALACKSAGEVRRLPLP
ncbi:MAG TPA: putative PEP-binding protein [Blastocatellia bacterium]|nr:putative PEP-binding protein [Blastocatellia bacterium]